MKVYSFATAWKSSFGGINVFNRQLCKALSDRGVDVSCICLSADDDDKADARNSGVHLVSADQNPKENLHWSFNEFAVALFPLRGETHPDFIILNDIICHEILESVATSYPDSKIATILHTAYGRSEARKGSTGAEIEEKVEKQQALIMRSAIVFTIGDFSEPYIQSISHTISPLSIRSILPGLIELPSPTRAPTNFHVMTFGRLDERADQIKQSTIALKSWMKAVRSQSIKDLTLPIRFTPTPTRASMGATRM